MKPIFPILALLACLMPLSVASQTPAELSRPDLRDRVRAGQTRSMAQILTQVNAMKLGEVVDARAFGLGDVLYRVTILRPSGVVTNVVINGTTGKVLPANSAAAQRLTETERPSQLVGGAKAKPGASSGSGNASSGNHGNNGNGNGNGGGNGNGNGGNHGNGGNNGNGNGGGAGKK